MTTVAVLFTALIYFAQSPDLNSTAASDSKRQTVRGEAPPSTSAWVPVLLPGIAGAFQVHTPGTSVAIGFETFEQAVENAPAGATIEIHDDGPFEVEPIVIENKPLIIAAAPGTHPVLRFERESDDEPGALIETDDVLVLKGLELRSIRSDHEKSQDDDSDDDDPDDDETEDEYADGEFPDSCLVHSTGASFFAANCRFVLATAGCCIALDSPQHCELLNCELHSGDAVAIELNADEDVDVRLANCLVSGATAIVAAAIKTELRIELDKNTLVCGHVLVCHADHRPPGRKLGR